MTAVEVPGCTNLTTHGVHTPVNIEEHKEFKALSNKSSSKVEHSVLKNIDEKQQTLTRSLAKNLG